MLVAREINRSEGIPNSKLTPKTGLKRDYFVEPSGVFLLSAPLGNRALTESTPTAPGDTSP